MNLFSDWGSVQTLFQMGEWTSHASKARASVRSHKSDLHDILSRHAEVMNQIRALKDKALVE